jgi:hypothetical protein
VADDTLDCVDDQATEVIKGADFAGFDRDAHVGVSRAIVGLVAEQQESRGGTQ